MELYGLEGTLLVHRLDGSGQLPLELFRVDAFRGLSGWIRPRTVGDGPGPDRAELVERALLADHLVDCLAGAPNALGADRARHVLEVMLAAMTSAREGMTVTLTTSFAA